LRQAYDYWQNQPGNYLNAKDVPEGSVRGLTSQKEVEVVKPSRDETEISVQPSTRPLS
jgi:hypothetical protein